MHAVAAGRLGIAFQLEKVQLLAHQLRRLDDLVVTAFERVEIDQHEVRMFQGSDPAHPGVLIDAGEIGEIQQRSAVVRDDVVDRRSAVFGIDRLQTDPVGYFILGVLLEKVLLVDAIWVALERERAIP